MVWEKWFCVLFWFCVWWFLWFWWLWLLLFGFLFVCCWFFFFMFSVIGGFYVGMFLWFGLYVWFVVFVMKCVVLRICLMCWWFCFLSISWFGKLFFMLLICCVCWCLCLRRNWFIFFFLVGVLGFCVWFWLIVRKVVMFLCKCWNMVVVVCVMVSGLWCFWRVCVLLWVCRVSIRLVVCVWLWKLIFWWCWWWWIWVSVGLRVVLLRSWVLLWFWLVSWFCWKDWIFRSWMSVLKIG